MSEDLVTQKASLRDEAKRARGLLSLNADQQDALCQHFFDHIDLQDGFVIGGYWPKGRELDTSFLMHSLIEKGFRVTLPVIEGESRLLKFARWTEDIDLEIGAYGIHQPTLDENTEWLEPDVFLVPLLAFDRRGYRLGYGGGYYDTTLSAAQENKDITAVGLAYAQQACLFNLPTEEHDIKMDWIITEQGASRYKNTQRFNMRILFVGDIMGRAGREALEKYLPELKEKLNIDVAIVNGENAAHGRGITEKFCNQFFEWGTDVITTGNHVWDQREILKYITREPKLVRPANFPALTTPGKGYYLHELMDGRKILAVNMMCRLFMDPLDDPFACMEDILKEYKLGLNCNAIFVDLHGETTSEKMSFGHHFSGRISAVIGTHTHVPTADAHIMNGKTAYMTDAGMTGDYDSVIGVKKETAITRFTRKLPGEHFIPASENMTLCGALVVTKDTTGTAISIEPIRIGDTLPNTMPQGQLA